MKFQLAIINLKPFKTNIMKYLNQLKILIFISLLCQTALVFGQNNTDVYPKHMENWLREHVAQNQNVHFKQSGDLVLVPLQLHLVSNNDGSERFSVNVLLERLCELNANFEETGFHFYLYDDINFIKNDSLNDFTDIEDVIHFIEEVYVNNAINIFYSRSPGGVCVYGYLPEADETEFIMLSQSSGCNGNNSLFLTRYIGRYFALPFTYNGWTHLETPDTPEYVTRDPNLRNCHEAGDFFCDTDADYLYFPWQYPFDPADFPAAIVTDPLGDTIHPDAELFMNRIQPQQALLPNRFSGEQMTAMQAYLFDERDYLLHPDPPQITEITEISTIVYPQNNTNQKANYSQLKWTSVNNAEAYSIEISSNPGFSDIIKDTIVSDTSVIFNDLPVSNNLRARVKAFNSTSFCSASSNMIVFNTTQSVSFTVNVETHFCAEANNGEIDIDVSGDNPPFDIQISGGQFTGLSAGKYDVIITDANQDTIQTEVDLYPYPDLDIQITQGVYALSANVNGGKPPYQYAWSNGSNEAMIENLSSGTYTVTVTDASGCETIATAEATSVDELEKFYSQIDVYPNPVLANQNIYIKINSPVQTSANYEIFNMQGKKVSKGNFELLSGKQSFSLQMQGFAPGVYTLKLVSGSNIYNSRIVVIQ
ncbi:MAG: T9SS C-terminal target domain-containing protein [Chitinophagaceae bacterium]|nr:MAG: T9SS C-terminal target domain-containing protein [Chitinophagaceae bacterium]